jgi:hypothetical protein
MPDIALGQGASPKHSDGTARSSRSPNLAPTTTSSRRLNSFCLPASPDQIVIARATPSPLLPAGSFSGGFRTMAPQRKWRCRDGAVIRNPSHQQTFAQHCEARSRQSEYRRRQRQIPVGQADIPNYRILTTLNARGHNDTYTIWRLWTAAGARNTGATHVERARQRQRFGRSAAP